MRINLRPPCNIATGFHNIAITLNFNQPTQVCTQLEINTPQHALAAFFQENSLAQPCRYHFANILNIPTLITFEVVYPSTPLVTVPSRVPLIKCYITSILRIRSILPNEGQQDVSQVTRHVKKTHRD